MRKLQPPGWAEPKGYANGVAATGMFVAIGGQIGWNAAQSFESDDFVAQARQALENVVAVLAEAGGRPEHIVRMTWYVVDCDEYVASQRELGRAYRDVVGRHYPAMTAVEVSRLVEPRAKVEIEATAIVPDHAAGASG
ncbi:2-aminomuconate deaminase [Burkholderiales bacterium]|nr:2-aminomuconate deaminase [Burkholderiales bacterium]